jgi:hypothetical protein
MVKLIINYDNINMLEKLSHLTCYIKKTWFNMHIHENNQKIVNTSGEKAPNI